MIPTTGPIGSCAVCGEDVLAPEPGVPFSQLGFAETGLVELNDDDGNYTNYNVHRVPALSLHESVRRQRRRLPRVGRGDVGTARPTRVPAFRRASSRTHRSSHPRTLTLRPRRIRAMAILQRLEAPTVQLSFVSGPEVLPRGGTTSTWTECHSYGTTFKGDPLLHQQEEIYDMISYNMYADARTQRHIKLLSEAACALLSARTLTSGCSRAALSSRRSTTTWSAGRTTRTGTSSTLRSSKRSRRCRRSIRQPLLASPYGTSASCRPTNTRYTTPRNTDAGGPNMTPARQAPDILEFRGGYGFLSNFYQGAPTPHTITFEDGSVAQHRLLDR